MQVIFDNKIVRVLGWIFLMVPAAVSIGFGLELTDTPWYFQLIFWPFLYIHTSVYRLTKYGDPFSITQKAILTPIGAYILRILWVLAALIIFFKYL